jgi:hypothetical protein
MFLTNVEHRAFQHFKFNNIIKFKDALRFAHLISTILMVNICVNKGRILKIRVNIVIFKKQLSFSHSVIILLRPPLRIFFHFSGLS